MNLSLDLRTRRGLLMASAITGALAYWRLLFWDPASRLPSVDAWLFMPADPFPQAIILIAAIIVYRRRESVRAAMRDRGSPALAALPLLVGSLLFLWGHHVDAMDLLLVSFVLVAIGTGLLWFGTGFVRALAIPLVVVLFTVPAPAALANQAFYALRLWTASHTAALLPLVGIPVFRHGNMIYGDDVVAQVIDTCSGLRSMEMLMLAAVLYVGWYPVRRARAVLLVVLAPVIAYAFNVVRVGVMAVYPTSEFSKSHSMQGMAVFLGAVFGLVLLDRLLARLFPRLPQTRADTSPPQAVAEPAAETPGTAPESAADPPPGPAQVVLAALLVTLLGVSIGMPQWESPPEEKRRRGPLLPVELGDWIREEKLEYDKSFYWTVSYSAKDYRRYERDGDELSVFIGYDDREYRSRSLLSPKNALPGRGWGIEEWSSISLGPGGPEVERVVAQSVAGRSLNYHWYEGVEPLAKEIARQWFGADQSRFRRPQPARVIRVSTDLGPDPNDWPRHEAVLREFATSLAAALQR